MSEETGSVERDVADFRELVRDRPQIADRAIADSRRRADILTARLDLLAALARYASGAQGTDDSAAVHRAVDALRPIAPLEGAVTVELVIGLIVTSRYNEAIGLLTRTLRSPQPGWSVADLKGWIGFLRHVQRTGAVGGSGERFAFLTNLVAQVTQAATGSALSSVVGSLAVEPDAPDADAVLRAQLALSSGDAAASLTVLDSLPAQAGAAPLAISTRVRALLAAGAVAQAVAVADTGLAEAPDDPRLLVAAGEALAAHGDRDRALLVLEHAEEQTDNPEHSAARALRGVLLSSDPATREDGIAVLQSIVADTPPDAILDPTVAVTLATALYDAGRSDEAMAEIDRALLGGVEDAQLYWLLALLLRERSRTVEALASVEQGARVAPARTEFHELRGELLEDLERYGEAASWYGQALTAASGTDAAESAREHLEALASTLFDRREFPDALVALDVLREHDLLDPDRMALRAELLRLASRFDEAIEQADTAAPLLANAGNLLATKAQALVSLSRSQEALTTIDRVLAADPANLFGWSVRVEAELELGGITAALATLAEHFPLESVSDEWRAWRIDQGAWCLALLGRPDEAEALWADTDPVTRAVGLAMTRIRMPGHASEAIRLLADVRDSTTSRDVHLDYADAMSIDGAPPAEAMSIYQAMAIRSSQHESPSDRVERGWAVFRSGRSADSALKIIRRALEHATDPLPFESNRAAVVAACGSNPSDAVALLERSAQLCRSLEHGPDAEVAEFVRNDFRFVADITARDSRFAAATPHLDELRQQLGAT